MYLKKFISYFEDVFFVDVEELLFAEEVVPVLHDVLLLEEDFLELQLEEEHEQEP